MQQTSLPTEASCKSQSPRLVVHDYSSYVRNRLNGCVTVIYRSVSTYKQARSQEVRRGEGGGGGGSINTSESIYPGAQIRERGGGGGGKSVRFPSRLAGQIRNTRHLRA